MPQVVAVWCEELGHDVSMVYYNGPEIIAGGIPDDVDIIFVNAFSQNAMLAYALSNYYRTKGAVTVLGGPHSRSYPDQGRDPVELSKRFLERVPGVYPLFSLLTSYGRNAPDNLRYQREGRVLNIPFHFLNQTHASNVRPKNYTWPELFGYTTDLLEFTFSHAANWRRFKAVKHTGTCLEQLMRGVSSGRGHKHRNMRMLRDWSADPQVRRYFEGETMELPWFYVDPIRKDLRGLWDWLPEGAIYHDPNTYLKSLDGESADGAHNTRRDDDGVSCREEIRRHSSK